jgi:hypothetical protein
MMTIFLFSSVAIATFAEVEPDVENVFENKLTRFNAFVARIILSKDNESKELESRLHRKVWSVVRHRVVHIEAFDALRHN